MTDPPKRLRGAPGCMILFGLVFAGFGAAMLLETFHVIHVFGRTSAPKFVLVAAGLAFLTPGLWFISGGLRWLVFGALPDRASANLESGVVVSLVLTCLALVAGGGAIFGKAEDLYGGLTHTTIEQRFWLGLGALLCGALAALFWTLTIAAIRNRRSRRPR